MTTERMLRIADWHGEQAAQGYRDWVRFDRDADLERFVRHTAIADRLWWRHQP